MGKNTTESVVRTSDSTLHKNYYSYLLSKVKSEKQIGL